MLSWLGGGFNSNYSIYDDDNGNDRMVTHISRFERPKNCRLNSAKCIHCPFLLWPGCAHSAVEVGVGGEVILSSSKGNGKSGLCDLFQVDESRQCFIGVGEAATEASGCCVTGQAALSVPLGLQPV